MYQNTKLLVLSSFLIIILGFSFLWFGLQPNQELRSRNYELGKLPSSSNLVPSSFPATSSANLSPEQGTQGLEGERAQVIEVVDGDTIKVSLNGQEKTVRFVGIDTPETVDPRRPVGCFGKEASNETKSSLS